MARRETTPFFRFTVAEARAIVAYLQYKAELGEFNRSLIEQAIGNFWSERAE